MVKQVKVKGALPSKKKVVLGIKYRWAGKEEPLAFRVRRGSQEY